jgi:putative endonuclease
MGWYCERMHFVYMIKNTFGDLYVGMTENPLQRLAYHNERRGALFTKRDSKFRIVFLEEHSTIDAARKREIQIKKWRREKKEMLIERYGRALQTRPQ